MSRAIWPLLALMVSVACSTGAADRPHVAPDVSSPPGDIFLDVVGVLDGMSSDIVETDVSVPAAKVKAMVVESADQLLAGPAAIGRVGDLRIENEYLAAVISAPGHYQWGAYGGGVLDIAPIGGVDYFTELFPIVGFLRGVKPDSVEVIADGTDGTAIIRTVGTDRPIPIIDAAIKTAWLNTEVTVDYVLEADSRCLEIRTTVRNAGESKATVALGDGLSISDQGRLFGEQVGYDDNALLSASNLAYIGAETATTSYLLVPEPSLSMSLAFKDNELSPVLYGFFDVAPGESITIQRCLYAGSGRSLGVLRPYWEDRGVALTELVGTLAVPVPGYPVSESAVEFLRDATQFAGSSGPDASGAFQAALPAGDYEARVTGLALGENGASFAMPLSASLDLALDPPARIDATVGGPEGVTVPARLSLQLGADAGDTVGIVDFAVTADGQATFFAPAADYTLVGSRGPFWSLCRANISAVAGEIATASCEIGPMVNVAGTVSADLHSHSGLGVDSTLHPASRVVGMLAEGIQFFASTDHDIYLDYGPLVAQLGLDGQITNSPGSEVSLLFAHFNCLGCPPQSGLYFEAPWLHFDEHGESAGVKTIPEVFSMMRDEMHAVLIQINHFREGTAFFDAIDYDPELGPSVLHPDDWSDNFDALEVWNSGQDLNHLFNKTLVDWYSLLNRGLNKVATGNSDSHALTQWAGQPRNLVNSESNTEAAVYDALAHFNSQVSSAPVIEFTVNGVGLGQTVAADDGAVEITIAVRAADWVPVNKVRLVANGDTVETWDVAPSSDVIRFEFSGSYEFQEDTWLHVLAYHDSDRLYPIYPGRTSLSFTHPIWVDVDGNGFQPPMTP